MDGAYRQMAEDSLGDGSWANELDRSLGAPSGGDARGTYGVLYDPNSPIPWARYFVQPDGAVAGSSPAPAFDATRPDFRSDMSSRDSQFNQLKDDGAWKNYGVYMLKHDLAPDAGSIVAVRATSPRFQ